MCLSKTNVSEGKEEMGLSMKNKILSIIVIMLIFIIALTNINYAAAATGAGGGSTESRDQTIDSVIGGADNFISGAETKNTISQAGVDKTIDLIYNILLAIGMIVAVTAGVILGIRFMVSSTEGKAEIKELLIPYITGCIVVFAAFGIWKIVMIFIGTI